MKRGVRTTLLGVAITLAVAAASWWFLNLYSVPRPYDVFVRPTLAFLQAGLALDSLGLVRMASAEAPVLWALETGRLHPVVLRDLRRDLHAVGGRRIGATTSVIFAGWSRGICLNHLLSVSFSGPPESPRIQDISTDCHPPR